VKRDPVRHISTAPRANECFADEIAIDFPSVEALVDRAREDFLGERCDHDTLLTEVELSARDARFGAVVPLDVPLRRACSVCGGRGEVWTEPCPACAGSGDALGYHPIRFAVPPGVADGSCFRFRVNTHDAAPLRVELRVAIARPKSYNR
jgi:hypothetical protein